MRKKIMYLACLLLLTACENAPIKKVELPPEATVSSETPLDKEINRLMEKGNTMGLRKQQVPAIEAVFARRTTPERSRQLAALCFTKTLGTPFMPSDLAEIALAETGGHRLSGNVASSRGALGVWQVMPSRARSHGYSSADLKVDEKCAEVAVRELYSKLEMADGNLQKAKKLYCGQGPQADAYLRKINILRGEINSMLERQHEKLAMDENGTRIR